MLTDVNSERPRAADVHLSLHSDLIIIIPLLQWLQASPPRPWWSSSSSPSWASSSWSYPGLCFGFSAAGETRTKSSAKGEWIIFVAQIKSVKHSMTHQFHSLNWYAFECISIVLFSQYNYIHTTFFIENWGRSWTNSNRESWKVSGRCQYPRWTPVTRRRGRPATSRSGTSCSARYLWSMRGIL